VGIDLIPAMPPRGVSTFQGDFLEERVRGMVKSFLKEGRKRDRSRPSGVGVGEKVKEEEGEVEVEEGERSYIDRERRETVNEGGEEEGGEEGERLVDVSGPLSPVFFHSKKIQQLMVGVGKKRWYSATCQLLGPRPMDFISTV